MLHTERGKKIQSALISIYNHSKVPKHLKWKATDIEIALFSNKDADLIEKMFEELKKEIKLENLDECIDKF
jgi:hypothetical protein